MCAFKESLHSFISQEREVKIKLTLCARAHACMRERNTHQHKRGAKYIYIVSWFREAHIFQKSGCQEADIKPIPCCRPMNIGHHHKKFSHHGNLIPRICALLSYLIHIFGLYVLLPPLFCVIGSILYTTIIAYSLVLCCFLKCLL